MADPQEESEIERVIVAAIEKHARGDVDALARDGSHSSAAAATFKQFSPHAVEHVVLLPCSLLW